MGKSKRIRQYLEHKWHDLYRMAYAWSHDPHMASDVVQEAISRALKKATSLRDERAMGVWVYRILLNCWLDRRKEEKRFEDMDDDIVSTHPGPEDEIERHNLIDCVRQAMASISHEHRQIVALVDLEGFSYQEVAEILQVPIGTVMSRLCRARQQLKQYLQRQGLSANKHQNIRRIK